MDEASTSCQYNFNLTLTDWIIVYEPNRKVKNDLTNFKSLIERISNEGFNLRTKKFGKNSLVIFLHCPNKVLAIQAYKSKLDDWVHHIGDNVKKPQPITEENYNLVADTLKPAERLRLIFDILVYPSFKGGIGLQVGFNCTDFFAPHDEAFNEAWINNWNQKLLLHDEDFDIIRDNLGETVAFYFAFLQFYFKSLIIPALVGCLSFFFDLKFSVTFGVFLVTYGLVFILRWEKNEVVWATKWGTKNINKKKIHRPDFKYTELKVDPVTSEITPFYPTGKRMAKILCITLPVLILSTILVTIFVAANLAFEMYITLYYKGPYPQIVQLIPLLSYGASIPTFNAFYSSMMVGLNKFENRPTEKEFTYSLTQKVFLILSLVNFLDLIFVGFWFIPFNDVFRDYLKSFGFLVWDGQKNLNLEFGPNFLTSRLISFIITGQVLNTFLEVGLPYLISKLSASTKKLAEKEKLNEDLMDLDEEEKKFFFRVLKEYKLPKQDNFNDYAELISQFGNIVLFSICWPPTAIFCFINNFIELRSDAIKIVKFSRRAIPYRSETIGPWKNNLKLVNYFAIFTITTLTIFFKDWNQQQNNSNISLEKLKILAVFLIINEKLVFLFDKILKYFFKFFKNFNELELKQKKKRETYLLLSKEFDLPLDLLSHNSTDQLEKVRSGLSEINSFLKEE